MIECEQLKADPKRIELNRFLDLLYSSHSENLVNSKITLIRDDTLRDESLIIQSDPSRLKQILDNLINNALKFTQEGEVRFGIKKEIGQISFYVSDEGQGIPESEFESIFQEFTKLEKDQQNAMRGVGLGLAISKHLSWLLEGELNVESTIGVGSTFALTFPDSICEN